MVNVLCPVPVPARAGPARGQSRLRLGGVRGGCRTLPAEVP